MVKVKIVKVMMIKVELVKVKVVRVKTSGVRLKVTTKIKARNFFILLLSGCPATMDWRSRSILNSRSISLGYTFSTWVLSALI